MGVCKVCGKSIAPVRQAAHYESHVMFGQCVRRSVGGKITYWVVVRDIAKEERNGTNGSNRR